ncbi:phosphoenolpyruvate synthase [Metallosphaera sedula]|uniref:Phosphoenolpyruvate synthase n=3 Tax=Metallosphaera TaxID=41980 RepID=A4YI92_METS5|nr:MULTISPECIES: phenylalanine--tRNA ligase beta subunit-related protein [Metallosphaera]ABP96144.1 phosphoenolpyruvate synthase [Metallosphaera sedula DSM 5348]AIM28127.1 phosphoenolpyruvate synthase [Metallosphaera sedula]AKV74951.1 tRNA synthetase subunit beta [Metallosphaera sedula]AKV77189.1 tRNA synthetase subunit beta [Metallosphaera sedula]AKV79439.1 tRNA synthetase subunit beta [Metallosphaera sedula]
MRISIQENCASMGIFVKHTEVLDLVNGQGRFEGELSAVESKFRSDNPESLKDIPVIRAYRDFYWKLGIDPTKTRPSGEALRRRIVRTGKLPRINDIVDAGNVVSAETLVSIGIYDLDKIKGEPNLVLSSGGEKFEGIGNKVEVLSPGIPIMVDGEGKVMHIFPHRDSVLTSVGLSTKNVLIVGAGVTGIDPSLVEEAVRLTAKLLSRIGGKIVHEVQ